MSSACRTGTQVRIAPLHPLLRDRPKCVAEIDLAPGRVGQSLLRTIVNSSSLAAARRMVLCRSAPCTGTSGRSRRALAHGRAARTWRWSSDAPARRILDFLAALDGPAIDLQHHLGHALRWPARLAPRWHRSVPQVLVGDLPPASDCRISVSARARRWSGACHGWNPPSGSRAATFPPRRRTSPRPDAGFFTRLLGRRLPAAIIFLASPSRSRASARVMPPTP